MLSDKKLKEISDCVKEYGRDYACEKFNLSKETLRRYIRFAAQDEKEPIDHDNNIILQRLSEKFSPGELKAFLKDKIEPRHGKSNYDFKGELIKFAIISDMHVGSQYINESRITSALDLCEKEGVRLVFFPGDVTEGMSGREGHVYELQHIGYHAQRQAAIDILTPYKDKFDIKMISGNHDLWYAAKANMGALIVKDICEALGAEYLGEHEAVININGIKIMLWHGEDGSSYALSYRMQKIIESLSGGEKPHILITGHDHKQGYFFTRNIHAVLGGCLQKQTPWMRRKKLAAHEGFWIIEMTISDCEVKRFKPEWIPFYV